MLQFPSAVPLLGGIEGSTSGAERTLSTSRTILLDAHVHLHPCFDPRRFLDSARVNFRAALEETGRSDSIGCLWLTDTTEERSFERLQRDIAGSLRPGGWSLSQTSEPTSLVASHESGSTLLLLEGRQISTRERLEVLALGTRVDVASGQSLGDTIAAVRDTGALAVIPWGFGKWWFSRRQLLAAALSSQPRGGIFVGDNGGRPRVIPRAPLFEFAASRGIYNLPGSDPLPLTWEVEKPGSFGAVLEGPLDFSLPVKSLIANLRNLQAQPPLFGRSGSIPEFARSQVGLRLRRRVTPAPDPINP
jgi:hypothetical protein